MFQNLRSWLRALRFWLWEARLAWLATLGLVIPTAFSLRPGVSEPEVRVWGLFLELLGLGTVLHGIRSTRQLFRRPQLLTVARQWLSRVPRWRRSAHVIAGAGTITMSGGLVRAEVWSHVPPTAPLDERVGALERNVVRLNERLGKAEAGIDASDRRHAEALRKETEARAAQITHLNKQVVDAETGGLHVSFIGALWLALGLLLGTLSQEIARWRS